MRKQLLITGLCCGLALVPTGAVLAQTTDQTDHQRVMSLEARVKSLEARVAALEQRLNMPPVTSAPASPPVTSASASPHKTSVAPAPKAPARPPPAAVAAPTTADWSQLHRGMDPREVTALIGPPDNREVRPMSEIWFYPDNRQLEFDHNGRLDSWTKP